MSQHERNGGRRELTYSNWHRKDSIGRFLTKWQAHYLYLNDVDANELCVWCYSTVALIETTRYRGWFDKNADSTVNLAATAGVPSYTVYYVADEPSSCHACGFWTTPWPDITGFYVHGPHPSADGPVYMEPQEYAQLLAMLRFEHRQKCQKIPALDRLWRLWLERAA